MSKYYGNIIEDDTIELTFNTFDADGASVTVTTFASTDVHVHKDGGLTQTNAGVTIDIDFDGVTGNHVIYIDTSADAFYATGSNYEVRVEGITVDTQLINAFIGSFSIENRFMRGTDGANTVVPDAAGVAPTAVENRQEMDSNSTQLAAIVLDTGTTLENRQVAILADVTGINGDAMRGTDIGSLNNVAATDIVTNGAIATDAGSVSLVNTVGDGAKDSTVAKAAVLGAAVGASISADIAAIPTTMVGTDNAATETKQDATDVVLDRVAAIQEADKVFVPASGTLTYNTKGTSTGILKKNLKDTAGAAVNSTEDIIASEVDTTP